MSAGPAVEIYSPRAVGTVYRLPATAPPIPHHEVISYGCVIVVDGEARRISVGYIAKLHTASEVVENRIVGDYIFAGIVIRMNTVPGYV